MSAVCRIIHLHGGPSDGLRLPWDGGLSEAIVPLTASLDVDSEYDYVYLPRLAKAEQHRRNLRLATQLVPTKAKRWQRVWRACRTGLLAPCSYPMDCRRYRVGTTAEISQNPQ